MWQSRGQRRIPIAITIGDPEGIGPEVGLKAIADPAVRREVEPLLVGEETIWRRVAAELGLDCPGICPLPSPAALAKSARRRGHTAAAAGETAYRAILAAVELVQTGRAQAVVTAPISKAHLNAAGYDYPGHTELLAHLAGDVPVRMMLAGDKLRVVLVTIHVALAEVPKRLERDHIVETIRITAASLRQRFGIARPRIAVAGLNPHAGEGGLFGREEIEVIAPAVAAARRRRIDAVGPLAADGIFAHAAQGKFDAVVCMYHDQGLGPFKLMHFADGVNLTLGLPFVRTSPDHGTAFDIAGKGIADASSMIAAVRLASRLARVSP